MAKNKYYVVWRGRKTGIFTSWEECKAQVLGFDGAQYKGYPTEDEARAAHAMNYWKAVGRRADTAPDAENADAGSPVVPSIAVDAACSGNPGRMEYRGVWTSSGKEIFRMGPFDEATNNIGEFLAIVHALALLKQNGSDMPLYSDSANAIAWVRRRHCNTRLAQTDANTPVFNLIARAEAWLTKNTYTTQIIKWPTHLWGEIPADFGRK